MRQVHLNHLNRLKNKTKLMAIEQLGVPHTAVKKVRSHQLEVTCVVAFSSSLGQYRPNPS